MDRVFIASPFRWKNAAEYERNIWLARLMVWHALFRGYAPFAPHLFFPDFLDEHRPEERAMGIQAGLRWLISADEVWIPDRKWIAPTSGMIDELAVARHHHRRIVAIGPDELRDTARRRAEAVPALRILFGEDE